MGRRGWASKEAAATSVEWLLGWGVSPKEGPGQAAKNSRQKVMGG